MTSERWSGGRIISDEAYVAAVINSLKPGPRLQQMLTELLREDAGEPKGDRPLVIEDT